MTKDINLILSEQDSDFNNEVNISIPKIKNFKNLHNFLEKFSIFYKKHEIVDLLIENIQKLEKESRILIFSENTQFINNLEKKSEIIKISKNIQNIEKIINNYNNNNSVLFLDSKYFNYGFNLEKTNHLILTHKLDPLTERQVINRAYRIGRTCDLNIYHLYHTNE